MIREDLDGLIGGQLADLEKLIAEMSESELRESATYLRNRISVNIEKIVSSSQFSVTSAGNDLLSRYEYLMKRIDSVLRSSPSQQKRKRIIFIIDGKGDFSNRNCGLVDKLRGIAWTYQKSKEWAIDFKLYWDYPVNINHFFIPNKYDWTIDKSEIDFDNCESKRLIANTNQNISSKILSEKMQEILAKNDELYFFTNHSFTSHDTYAQLFDELFRPTVRLQNALCKHLNNLYGDGNNRPYISISFRFMRLLGDFVDIDNHPTLLPNEQEELIGKCLRHIETIHRENPDKIILVTSDSVTFIKRADAFDYVYIVPGARLHIGYSLENNVDDYMNVFEDYMLLTKSSCIYQVVEGDMYQGGFAHYASFHNKTPYILLGKDKNSLADGNQCLDRNQGIVVPKTYLEIYQNHHHYFSFKVIQYFFIYDKIFQNILLRNKPINLLEIGVANGGSLEIWKKYLPAGSQIHGVDINRDCLKLEFEEGIHFHLGSATDLDFMHNIFKDIVFDVILDDGSHICEDVIKTFEFMFPRLRPGGLYIAEDICTSYWESHGGKLLKPTSSIEYFKKIADYVNRQAIEMENDCLRAVNISTEMMNYLADYVCHVAFYDCIVLIEKLYERKPEIKPTIRTGDIGLFQGQRRDFEERIDDVDKCRRSYCGF